MGHPRPGRPRRRACTAARRYSEIHMVGGEHPHIGYDYYPDVTRALHEALPGRPPEAVHGLRDPPHDEALGHDPRARCWPTSRTAGLGSLPGGGAEVFADRVRRLIAPGKEHPDNWIATHRAAHEHGHPDALHDALRPRRDLRGAGRPLARAARPAGRDRRLPGLHPAAVPPREHRLRAARLALLDRLRRPEDDRRLAAHARQHPEHQGVLDHDLDAARPGRAALRRERHPGHRDGGADRPRRRRRDAAGGEDRRPRLADPRGGPRPRPARHALQHREDLR